MMRTSLLTFVVLALSAHTQAYTRTASLSGQNFLDAFWWDNLVDPTKGRVDYVTQSTAEADGLYSVSGNTVILRPDNTTVLSPSGPGRKSFRLQSHNQFTEHVAIFDIGHMPQGCGAWPAIWFYCGNGWPRNGEIDVIEGVNLGVRNQATLHTTGNCVMPESRPMTGQSVGSNCDVYPAGDSGCGVRFTDSNSFGPNFNNNGGGWYAMEWSSEHIAIYFWERQSSSVPHEVANPGNTVNPGTWGTPAAYFVNTNCDFKTHLGPMSIIINLTFCGEWAGNVYKHAKGCPSTCVDFVNNNPGAFSDAYFEIHSLNIFE